jgi:hypothetical protein
MSFIWKVFNYVIKKADREARTHNIAIIFHMQYYSLHCAAKKIGRGGFPQVQNIELEEGRKVTDSDFVWQLRGDRFPEFNPYIGTHCINPL